MTGLCAQGSTYDCKMRGEWVPGALKCTEFEDAVAPHSPKWAIGTEHGEDIQCNTELGYTAVGVCTSGRRWDCRCMGGSAEGCDNQYKWHSHLLRCAKGIELIEPHQTEEKVSKDWGNDIACSPGYVLYKMCSSGRDRNCRDRY